MLIQNVRIQIKEYIPSDLIYLKIKKNRENRPMVAWDKGPSLWKRYFKETGKTFEYNRYIASLFWLELFHTYKIMHRAHQTA